MSSRKLFIVDPFNKEHQELLNNFDIANSITTASNEYIKRITSTMSREDYQKEKKNSNEVEECLIYMEDDKVIDTCLIEIEKDIKSCSLTFAPLSNSQRRRKFIELTTYYALEELNLEEVFVKVDKNDNFADNLRKIGYEDLGEVKGSTVFLKEKEAEEVFSKTV